MSPTHAGAARAAWAFTWLHALALVAGLFGILVAIPHPELWAGRPGAAAFYAFALNKTGGAAMVLGAVAMLAYGLAALGVRRTLVFFVAATVISASAELTGTKTGWPFGGYEYTDFLGPKLLGRVPAAIPLSWFYMGFASFVLADAIAVRRRWRNRALWSVVLGAWLLTAWDLVLDPSMAAPQMQYVHFWIWHESGPYFGMPLRNLAGWFGTGLLFIAAARILWNERGARGAPPAALPFTVYALNVVWSMVLSVSAGMWPTALAAIALALVPAALALQRARHAASAA
jgi:carotene biosynthesis associated membrane protein